MTATDDHELTVTVHNGITVGRCKCRRFSMIGPRYLINQFHASHLSHPSTTVTASDPGGVNDA